MDSGTSAGPLDTPKSVVLNREVRPEGAERKRGVGRNRVKGRKDARGETGQGAAGPKGSALEVQPDSLVIFSPTVTPSEHVRELGTLLRATPVPEARQGRSGPTALIVVFIPVRSCTPSSLRARAWSVVFTAVSPAPRTALGTEEVFRNHLWKEV